MNIDFSKYIQDAIDWGVKSGWKVVLILVLMLIGIKVAGLLSVRLFPKRKRESDAEYKKRAETLSAVVSCVGIGFQRGSHANWQLVHNDASGAPTLTDMGASFAIATGGVLTLLIAASPNAASVWVRVVDEVTGAVFEQEVTTDLPAPNQFLAPRLFGLGPTRVVTDVPFQIPDVDGLVIIRPVARLHARRRTDPPADTR